MGGQKGYPNGLPKKDHPPRLRLERGWDTRYYSECEGALSVHVGTLHQLLADR
jgi:hypothetical protein